MVEGGVSELSELFLLGDGALRLFAAHSVVMTMSGLGGNLPV
jgi:hypothetical protein